MSEEETNVKTSRDFSESKFEVQVKYPDGWQTIERLNNFDAQTEWLLYRRRYRTVKLRLLRNGVPIDHSTR